MKNGSFEYSKSKYLEDNNKDIIYPNNKKRRVNSNISSFSGFNIFSDEKNDKFEYNENNITHRNQSHMATLLSLKQTEKEDIIKYFNDYQKKMKKNKKSSKKKNLNMKIINNNSLEKNKSNKTKLLNSNKSKLKSAYLNCNTERVSKRGNNSNKNINKANNLKLNNKKLNTFNKDNKQKYSINISCINNNSISKFDSIHKSNKIFNSNKELSISTNTNSDNKNLNIITFGSTQSKKMPSEFVYIKKNNLCYSNSNLNKSKNKIHFIINSFSNTLNENNKENNVQNAINEVNISEFRLDDNKENNDENINDVVEEENINKINISYIGKYKTIGQIEKKIESENLVKRIINNNLNKKIHNMKFRQNNKEANSLYNEGDIETAVLNTATFGSIETEKKH